MVTSIDIADLARHAAVIVATGDAELRPEMSRAWGPSLSDDGARLTVCVEAAPGSTMARNLQPGRPVAVTIARLTSHTTVQLKGRALEAGAPSQERLDAVEEHIAGFVAETAKVGVPEAIARALVGTDLMTVIIEIGQRFDETPGPDAGRLL